MLTVLTKFNRWKATNRQSIILPIHILHRTQNIVHARIAPLHHLPRLENDGIAPTQQQGLRVHHASIRSAHVQSREHVAGRIARGTCATHLTSSFVGGDYRKCRAYYYYLWRHDEEEEEERCCCRCRRLAVETHSDDMKTYGLRGVVEKRVKVNSTANSNVSL